VRSLIDARWIILVIWEIKFKRRQLKTVDKEEMVTVIKEAKPRREGGEE
jgi:hypothetical protein